MAITRAQQAKQMLQNGGMLVQPGFGGTRQGYRGDDAYGGGDQVAGGGDQGNSGDKGDGPATGADSLGDLNRESRMGDKGKTRSGKADKGEGLSKFFTPTNLLKSFITLKTGIPTFNPTNLFNTKKGIKDPNVYEQAKLDFFTDDDDDTVEPGGEGEYIAPTFAQTQFTPGLPVPVMPMQKPMDLNRIAYRFFADGGFLDDEDEPRQAYGLGSFVKKITKPITKTFKKTVNRVKKVAKSPIGRLAIAVAAPYALGPAFGSGVMGSLSAAQKAALISGATTGVTQLASGEDLDLKEIALSAALSGGISKLTTPAGIDPSSAAGRARVASDVSARSVIPDRAMGQIPARTNLFDEVALTRGETILPQAKPSIIPDRGMGQIFERAATKDTGILQRAKDAFTSVKDSKLTDILLKNKKGDFSPLKGILLASTLAGIGAKKQQEPDEFTEIDRGEGIDIPTIRRSPFDYLAPRFAGSEFDFYGTSAADGGRIGYDDAGAVLSKEQIKKVLKNPLFKGFKTMYSVDPNMARENEAYKDKFDIFEQVYKQKFQEGGKAEPVAKKVMPLLDMGGMEKDYREDGGFVPIGRMEKADDVPARLSKNEFVFTADAVRNAGDGDVDKGAEVMYNMMKNLEAGGDVSEESQGLEGARKMFQTSQRLEEVI